MCGIVGAVNCKDLRKYLLDGLISLEYRGYDSAGIAILNHHNVDVYRQVGRVELLNKLIPQNLHAQIGIGHTRWATHGEPLEKNCHPQTSFQKLFTLVHNGVIENFQELKKELLESGYKFNSDTDTEVIADVIEQEYLQSHDILKALNASLKRIEGSLALAIIAKDDNEHLYFVKRKSPLLIGTGDTNYLASDALAMNKVAKKFVYLEDEQYGCISATKVEVFQEGKPKKINYTECDSDHIQNDLNGYPHYMLKEIEEIPNCLNRLIDNYFVDNKFNFNPDLLEALKSTKKVTFIACGTSYHACLMGKQFMEQVGKSAEAYIASEWAYFPHFANSPQIFILVSQSGETADVITCLQIIKKHHYQSLTITNTKGSTLERDADWSSLLYAGVEIAVASTKAYTSQIALMYLLTQALNNNVKAVSTLRESAKALQEIINKKEEIKDIAQQISTSSHAFFLGRGSDYYVALEASLKLKEITYIHSEAFPGGELKHGPLALVENSTPVFAFLTLDVVHKAMRNNIAEVVARKAKVYTIVSQKLKTDSDNFILPNIDESLSVLGVAIFSQYLAYYTALKRGNDIDKPRNLAKSVTVE